MMWRGGEVVVGDLVLAEVLQGAVSEKEFAKIQQDLAAFDQLTISDGVCAVRAAENFRLLRAKGITVRKTIDTLIATRCIIDKIPLLYSDRDFDPFVEHLGLISAVPA
jgi:predicted nucleic acid-binding protein